MLAVNVSGKPHTCNVISEFTPERSHMCLLCPASFIAAVALAARENVHSDTSCVGKGSLGQVVCDI
ncbi:unnamed protein product [Cyprideis torosa]|uniref:Uncharacterized protein n=1 Tax=Cyprideis torosa TaxID=163714 RepID=A0A7R8ZP49_9CRUS|nr:unnamed protein product [Cyprideis torosa]CAG0897921.1 unnamed protein product [Cyprideis torosa]